MFFISIRKPTSRHHHLFQGFNRKIIAQNHSLTKFQHFNFNGLSPRLPQVYQKNPPKKKSPHQSTPATFAPARKVTSLLRFLHEKTTALPHKGFPQGFPGPVGGSEVLHQLIGSLSHDLQGFEKKSQVT